MENHIEHHIYPNVPFHSLAGFRREIDAEIRERSFPIRREPVNSRFVADHDVDMLQWWLGPVGSVSATTREHHGLPRIDDLCAARG